MNGLALCNHAQAFLPGRAHGKHLANEHRAHIPTRDGDDRHRVQGSGRVDPRHCAAVVSKRPAHAHPAASVAGVMHGHVDADGAADSEVASPRDGGNNGHAAADGREQGECAEVVQFPCERESRSRVMKIV